MRKQVWRTLLVLLLVLSMLPGSEVFPDGSWSIMTEAAGKQKAFTENPKLSKTKCNLNNKKSTVVTVKGTKKSFSVGSSDKTIATVKKTGKYTFKITAAKKKKGRAVIFVKTFKGYRYALVTVGKKTTMSSKTKAWAIKAGFIKQREKDPATPSGSVEDYVVNTNTGCYASIKFIHLPQVCGELIYPYSSSRR